MPNRDEGKRIVPDRGPDSPHLLCGEVHTRHQQALGLHDYNTLNYLLTDNQEPAAWSGANWRGTARPERAACHPRG